jgi:tetratricopeptide (TPR) repeat protein/hypothetical membrane protein
MSEKKIFTLVVSGLFILLIVAYSNHFNNGFHFDDFHTIVNNPAIRDLGNLPQFFSDPTMFSSSPNHRGVRPLVTTSIALDYKFGNGLTPFFFQLSTFLWHIGLCIILFLVYRKILSVYNRQTWTKYIALFGAAWFGLHTAGAETLNYIISRSDVLSTFFIVLSLWLFIAFPERRKRFGYILAALVGIFAKETVPVLVILLFFYLLYFEKGLSIGDLFKKSNRSEVKQIILTLLPITIAIALVQLYMLSKMQGASVSYGMSNPIGYYWLTQTWVWFLYFKSFFLPLHLSADSDLDVITSFTDPRVLGGLVFVALLIYTIIKTSKKPGNRAISFGLIWFAASLLPTSLVPFAEVMNDHRMYFAFTGLSLSVVTALGNWIQSREKVLLQKGAWKDGILAACVLVIGLNAYGVFQRNKVWRTEETLWYDVTQKSPNNGRGWMNYGLTLMERGDYQNALVCYLKALPLSPMYSTLMVNLGIVYGGLNQPANAESYFKRAISLAPQNPESYSYYSRYLAMSGDLKDAKWVANQALSLNAVDIVALDAKMLALQGLKEWGDLEKTAMNKLALFPGDVNALNFLAAAKNKKAAVEVSPKPLLTPKTAADFIDLSLILYRQGKFEESIRACEDALKLDPRSADAYSNIGAAYNSLGQFDKGIDACRKALAIDPNHQYAKGNLNWALSGKK